MTALNPETLPVGTDPQIALIQAHIWELSQRLEDLAAFVAAHLADRTDTGAGLDDREALT
jgi:hypothetical protein